MTDTETKLQDAVTQFDLAANTDDEAMVRSCINAMIAIDHSMLRYEVPMGMPAGVTRRHEPRSQIQSSRPVFISKSSLFVQELADGMLGRQAQPPAALRPPSRLRYHPNRVS